MINGYQQIGVDTKNLPELPRHVCDDADFMIGIKYLRNQSEKIFQLSPSLSIYKSWLKN